MQTTNAKATLVHELMHACRSTKQLHLCSRCQGLLGDVADRLRLALNVFHCSGISEGDHPAVALDDNGRIVCDVPETGTGTLAMMWGNPP